MREDVLQKIELKCPCCRQQRNGELKSSEIKLRHIYQSSGDFILEALLQCANQSCAKTFPVVNGVPIVLKDIQSWWQLANNTNISVSVQSSQMRDYFSEITQRQQEKEYQLISVYMEAHYGEFIYQPKFTQPETNLGPQNDAQFWDTAITMALPETGKHKTTLDIGCSVGRMTFELAKVSEIAIGIDLDLNKLVKAAEIQRTDQISFSRRRRGKLFEKINTTYATSDNCLFMVADALDPPFAAESFDRVVGLNVIDNVPLPLVLLGQMDALTKSGGELILSSPYEWREETTEQSQWLESNDMTAPEMLIKILTGNLYQEMELKYSKILESDNIMWTLRQNDRHWTMFNVHFLKATKQAPFASSNLS